MVISAASARRSACLFHWGNILAVMVPVPFIALWFGASIFVYAMNREHPEPRVGRYTQRAANRFYVTAASVIVLGKFVTPREGEILWWFLLFWGAAIVVVVLPSLLDLYRIRHEQWHDIDLDEG